jgi:hypothetical protein
MVVIVAVTGLLHQDMRNGLALALLSLRGQRKLFWVGWAIHAAFTVFVAVIVIWLEFFWHW